MAVSYPSPVIMLAADFINIHSIVAENARQRRVEALTKRSTDAARSLRRLVANYKHDKFLADLIEARDDIYHRFVSDNAYDDDADAEAYDQEDIESHVYAEMDAYIEDQLGLGDHEHEHSVEYWLELLRAQ